jgi:hypothetical protein
MVIAMKTNLASLSQQLRNRGWQPAVTEDLCEAILASGLRGKNLPLAVVATDIAAQQKPLTVRGLFYRVVSAGWLPSTDKKHYDRLGRLLTTLREENIVPFSWIVDHGRSTLKPSSWSGLDDFVETVQAAYRKDFWERLPCYVHVFCEKDAIAGTLSPVTEEFDVALSPVRGYCSLSYAYEIASLWNRIAKPIHAYYLGDFDPSGFDLERDLKSKLTAYCRRPFAWRRLGVLAEDFTTFQLLPLAAKASDRRYQAFTRCHGAECAELDALPATELRRRVRAAIEVHVPQAQWAQMQEIERCERASLQRVVQQLKLP